MTTSRHYLTVKRSVLLLLLALSAFSGFSQSKVCFGNKPGDNDFNFPAAETGALLHGESYAAFFYGETHTRFFEPMFKLHLVKLLNAEYGVRDVFMEMGYAPAVVFNKFLETGDTSDIRIRVLYTTAHYMEFWQELYAYNKKLPENKKIRIHGIDFEATSAFFHALLILTPETASVPASLAATFKKLNTYSAKATLTPKEYKDGVKEVTAAFSKHHEEVVKLYGSNYSIVDKILNNDITMTSAFRNRKMGEHLQRELDEHNIDKFVGLFGSDHVNYEHKTALPNYLAESAKFKDKILTIRTFCFNAFDNWSHETLECIGTYSEKDGHTLFARYRDNGCRAILISSQGLKDDILNKSADFYLFANDQAVR